MEDIPNKIQSNMTRVERYAFPPDAVRELVYNALIHSDWSRGIPVQIKVLPNTLFISNVAVLPRNLTVEKLLGMHRSKSYNSLIAEAFYRAGYIESWGRGIDKVRRACEANGNPMAHFELDDSGVSARVDLPDWWEMDSPATTDDAMHSDFKSDLEGAIVELISQNPRITMSALTEALGVARRLRKARRDLQLWLSVRRLVRGPNCSLRGCMPYEMLMAG